MCVCVLRELFMCIHVHKTENRKCKVEFEDEMRKTEWEINRNGITAKQKQ